MRDTHEKKLAILVTDDPTVETAAREVAKELGEFLQVSTSCGDATCNAFDAPFDEAFAVVDVDARFTTRSMFCTIAGLMPVIAVTCGRVPWLKAQARRHRFGVSVTKPVTREAMFEAFRLMEGGHEGHPHHGR